MKLAVLIVLILVATLVYGSLPVTTSEFLALERPAAMRMLAESMQSQVHVQGTGPALNTDEQLAVRVETAYACVQQAAQSGEGSQQAIAVIHRCSML